MMGLAGKQSSSTRCSFEGFCIKDEALWPIVFRQSRPKWIKQAFMDDCSDPDTLIALCLRFYILLA